MKTVNTLKKIKMVLKRVIQLASFAVVYYFWSLYLSCHFVGGFNSQGEALALSATGMWFFWHVWPVWLLPFLVSILLMRFWKRRRIRQLHAHVALIEQERIHLQQQLQIAQTEKHVLNEYIYRQDSEVSQEGDYQRLLAAFTELREEYRQSKELVDSLLKGQITP